MASAQLQRPEDGYTWFPSLAYWMKVPSSSHLRKQGGFLCCHWAYLYAGTCHGVLELSGCGGQGVLQEETVSSRGRDSYPLTFPTPSARRTVGLVVTVGPGVSCATARDLQVVPAPGVPEARLSPVSPTEASTGLGT